MGMCKNANWYYRRVNIPGSHNLKSALSRISAKLRLHASHRRRMGITAIIVAFLALGLILSWAMPPLPGTRGIEIYLPLHTLL